MSNKNTGASRPARYSLPKNSTNRTPYPIATKDLGFSQDVCFTNDHVDTTSATNSASATRARKTSTSEHAPEDDQLHNNTLQRNSTVFSMGRLSACNTPLHGPSNEDNVLSTPRFLMTPPPQSGEWNHHSTGGSKVSPLIPAPPPHYAFASAASAAATGGEGGTSPHRVEQQCTPTKKQIEAVPALSPFLTGKTRPTALKPQDITEAPEVRSATPQWAAPQRSAIPFSTESPSREAYETHASMPASHELSEEALRSDSTDGAPALNDESGVADGSAPTCVPFLASTMPHGHSVALNLRSSWGDLYEIGLCGIEVFDEKGERVLPLPRVPGKAKKSSSVRRQQMKIEKGISYVRDASLGHDVHLLAQYPSDQDELQAVMSSSASAAFAEETLTLEDICSDPRRQLSSLVDGLTRTHDERHMTIVPYTPGQHHLICFVFQKPITISVVRLHNYCGKDRVHTTKGVRELEMLVDDNLVFRGEIKQHSGEFAGDVVHGVDASLENCEYILFTEDEQILERVLSFDTAALGGSDQEKGRTASFCVETSPPPKYYTSLCVAPRGRSEGMLGQGEGMKVCAALDAAAPPCPTTAARPSVTEQAKKRKKANVCSPECCPTNVSAISIMILSTWGDSAHVGLSGLRLRDARGDLVAQPITDWCVLYQDTAAIPKGDESSGEATLSCLFDEDVRTAAFLPFQFGMQIIFYFAEPIPVLGFLEVANYSVNERTFCGVKETRVFVAGARERRISNASHAVVAAPSRNAGLLYSAFAHLWTLGKSAESRRRVAQTDLREVTPTEGVCLRKAPACLLVPRFQTYDLSLMGSATYTEMSDVFDVCDGQDADGEDELHIGVGPGTGGTQMDAMVDSFSNAGSGGNRFGCLATSSLSGSLNMSINVRAAVAIRRARMMLDERPAWLLDYEPYMTPLLPVGYVCKVRLAVCARTVNVSSFTSSARSVHIDVNNLSRSSATENQQTFKSRDNLKSFMKEWVVKPLRSCFFVNEEGRVWRPVRPGSRPANAVQEDEDEYEQELPMVAESVITPVHSTAAQRAMTKQQPLQVNIDLVFVADRPFCLAMLVLNKPLVYEGMAAWVKHVYVHVDDTLVYDSGDAALQLDASPTVGRAGGNATNTHATPAEGADAHVEHMKQALPKYNSSLRKYILFTLERKILQEVKKDVGL